MNAQRIFLFRLFGYPVWGDFGTFFLAFLVIVLLGGGLFPTAYGELSPATCWLMGVVAALGVWVSVLLHELAHVWTARHYRQPVRGITLNLAGGIAELTEEAPNAETEFMVALAGPVASLATTGTLAIAWLWGKSVGWPLEAVAILGHLAGLNLLFTFFNSFPALPLDGGRVVRAIFWHWKGDRSWATEVTAKIGTGFGLALILIGILEGIRGQWVIAVWMLALGFLLRRGATRTHEYLLLHQTLAGLPVSHFMQTKPLTVPRSIPVSQVVEEYLMRNPGRVLPVVDDGRWVGSIALNGVRELPRDEWSRQSAGALAQPATPDGAVAPDDDALAAYRKMSWTGFDPLMVVDGQRLVGVLGIEDLFRQYTLKKELGA